MKYIKYYTEIGIKDINKVGGKNASLGEMIRNLHKKDITIPLGFAVTSDAYWHLLESNKLIPKIKKYLNLLKKEENLSKVGKEIRKLIFEAKLPEDVENEIAKAYTWLSKKYKQKNLDVAVRSSATAEDLPHASFAGQQETFLNVRDIKNVLISTKKCMASLFTNRAIIYRIEQGFGHLDVGISVGIQKMVRSDLASSGVTFSLDTETGFENVIVITSSYGLGENIVKGIVNPDEFHVHKPTLKKGFKPIIKKYLGTKDKKLIYVDNPDKPLKNISVNQIDRSHFSLNDNEIIELAKDALTIEEYYSNLYKKWYPIDIEWAKDGIDKKLYILQARPETVHIHKRKKGIIKKYHLEKDPEELNVITTGLSIGQKIAVGKAHILKDISQASDFSKGDILITTMTDPDWVPLMKKAAGIITDQGGRTCHAAIVSRELGIPAIVGTSNATKKIQRKELITLDCSQGSTGFVYKSKIKFKIEEINLAYIPKSPVPVMVNIADPEGVYKLSYLPVSGVGLARIEFIITNFIKVHPMAICRPEKIKDEKIIKIMDSLSAPYKDYKDFFISSLAQGIGSIAAAFYPLPVIVRFSDFKSNEYRNLLGGDYFEPIEENPMLGFRGSVRYCSPDYEPAFELECQALKKARNEMGLKNIKILIPFVRTPDGAKCTIQSLEKIGLKRGKDNLEIYMMVEIPSNVILLEKFGKYFDGFSIGSNDLTQFILAVDRDSAKLADLFDERDPAVMETLSTIIKKSKKMDKYVSICGEAPSDYPKVADFLIKKGIDALSLNPDSVIPFLYRFKKRD